VEGENSRVGRQLKVRRPSVLVQDVAQVNEENLPAYNRCALYALGAAYLNLISQLTTVPAFCQHIHEVSVLVALIAQEALLGLGVPRNHSSLIVSVLYLGTEENMEVRTSECCRCP
jgi:hypothetical protein